MSNALALVPYDVMSDALFLFPFPDVASGSEPLFL